MKTLKGPQGLKLVLDRSQVFLDDPGAGTPAMVEKGKAFATYWCACGEGELLDHDGLAVKLSDNQLAWLDQHADFVDAYLYGE